MEAKEHRRKVMLVKLLFNRRIQPIQAGGSQGDTEEGHVGEAIQQRNPTYQVTEGTVTETKRNLPYETEYVTDIVGTDEESLLQKGEAGSQNSSCL